ncbi:MULTISPECIES: hypothetical protein [Bacillus]|uniref:hypothetical protein n=1 Tax=Bacillus TaxID=1386 RepID=UPI00091EE50D|nr:MULTISPECIES: hypothetical protein [Bacillus]MED3268669.1 hypothetical protein [Bacillus thuringiensis]PEW24485.1 hypothetical protein CN427_25275 [Bacillus thuringiensis]PFV38900.1 hypothetical protein COL03_26595 [Bacillus thuringiensis]PFV43161.1 hypothetical protein COL14_28800 [Bacillus thuringiensis]PGW69974.1 hypothetical protein COE21_27615 [Bacillus thuringiensis]
MCKFCSNQKNTKFKLFDIKPIPFFIPSKSFANSSELQESPDTSTKPIRPQKSPDTSIKLIRPQESADASAKPIRSQESPDTSTKPIRPQESTDASAKPLKKQKSSRVLLKLNDTFNNPPTSKKFILSRDNSQLIYSQKESHYQIDTSNNIEIKTIEIKKLLRDYQLTNLYIILFLEDIHIKGFILQISKDLVTIIGPNIKVESNSTDNLIGSPNKINVKLEMIQGIGDVGASLSS